MTNVTISPDELITKVNTSKELLLQLKEKVKETQLKMQILEQKRIEREKEQEMRFF